MSFQRLNTFFGWATFLIATFVYVSTIEPTASFWDCGEFIATAFKLQVGHPPGAPFFMMIGRFFTLFTPPDMAAMMINILSALCSSFTILFLFWSITAIAKKLMPTAKESAYTSGQKLAIMGSGVVGALAYTFSDSFWFSAVEGEVYAMSSLFTALVFWAILKWESVADQPHANRWLVLIAYLMGLSIGVHLLNLLAIPAMVFVYYFKKYPVTRKGIIMASVTALAILIFIQYGIIPGIVSVAAKFELLFVNSFGLPFNTGTVVYALLLISAVAYGLHYSAKKGMVLFNTVVLCFAVILIGYSTFAAIVIRSSADPPMDENNPENVFTLLSYINREQYGDRPLHYGHFFNSPLDNQEPYVDGKPVYFKDKEKGKYIVSDPRKKSIPNYADEFSSVFPRMYSSDSRHVKAYKQWSDFKGKPVRYRTVSGETEVINKPTFGENLQFFFTYQMGWMYGRYFMWNFSGRQNDVQGHGNITEGNWISGIKPLDAWRLGNQDKLPSSISDNEAHNKFYMLPFILGLIGLFFQFSRNKHSFSVVALLFFFTGIAIVIYLNQYPYQPRERDYAYAASFYAYAIWIGLGVLGLYQWMSKRMNSVISAGLITAICLAFVPGIMAMEGWDDHDRSKRYTARDFAKSYLDSCEPNAILFTNGDNDTFPLWYVQEVEGYRTDVRVCNLSLLNTDWYIEQMTRQAYDSDPVPFSMSPDKYRQGTRDYLPIVDQNKKGMHVDVKSVMDFAADNSKAAMFSSDRKMNYIPTKKLSIKVDSAKVIANGTMPAEFMDQMVDEVQWTLGKSYVLKNDMMILDLLANFNWDRPVYFAITTGNASYIGLEDHFQLEGLAYRLVPYKAKSHDGQTGQVHTGIMYENLMNKFEWGGMDKGKIYMDENNRRMCMNLRNNFSRLADALIAEGKKEKAIKVLDKCLEVMPEENVPFNFFMLPIAETYYKAGAPEKANAIIERLADIYEEELDFYLSLEPEYYRTVEKSAQQAISVMYRLDLLLNQTYKQGELGTKIKERFEHYQNEFMSRSGGGEDVIRR